MTVQPADIEPEEHRAQSSDWRRDPGFRWPDPVPWSQLREDFIGRWGLANPRKPEPEHFEIVGPTGSGKTYLLCTALQDRMRIRQSAAVIICTKPADGTIAKLGWPITDRVEDLNDEPNVIFWPRTKRMGSARKDYHERKIADLLHRLWKPGANRIVAFDEVGYVESLSGEMRALVQQYWREARSQGITVVAMKQRPQGALRDMHSETYWTAVFPPKDRADTERFAELLGAKRDWVPVLDSLDKGKRQFVLRDAVFDEAYVTWIDEPLTPVRPKRKVPRWMDRHASPA